MLFGFWQPVGIPSYVYVGPKHRITLYTNEDHTVKQIVDKVNSVLKDYDGWTETYVIGSLSSRWAMVEHLEYCDDDKLSELDDYKENVKTNTLEFIAVNDPHLKIEEYDQYEAIFAPAGAGVAEEWNPSGDCHVIVVKEAF